MKSSTLFMAVASVIAIGAFVAGLTLIDSPQVARWRRLDEHRISDLQNLARSIQSYRNVNNRLPEKLEQLNILEREWKDPETGQPYEYKARSADSYDLCAVFDTTPKDDERYPFYNYSECSMPSRKYTQGRYCFTVSAKACK